MNLDVLVTGGISLFTTFVGYWAGWFFTRKKYNSEVDGNVIKNMQEVLDYYKELCDDNRARLHEVLEENKVLRREVDTLNDRVNRLTESICTDLLCQVRKKDVTTLELAPKVEKTAKKNEKSKSK